MLAAPQNFDLRRIISNRKAFHSGLQNLLYCKTCPWGNYWLEKSFFFKMVVWQYLLSCLELWLLSGPENLLLLEKFVKLLTAFTITSSPCSKKEVYIHIAVLISRFCLNTLHALKTCILLLELTIWIFTWLFVTGLQKIFPQTKST